MPTKAEVVAALVALVRAAPEQVIVNIAQGDSYADPADNAKHLTALKAVIDVHDCRLDRQANNHWYPREPLELVSYGADGQGLAETCVANALLMIADLSSGTQDYMDYRWHHTPGRAWFEALPERFRTPLLEGMKLLLAEWDAEGDSH